nr:NAD(P)H-hydrate dehydratase [Chloroflexota bacterium]
VDILGCARDCLDALAAGAPDDVVSPARPARGRRGRRAMVFAIDCPSGVDCDSGRADPSALAADITMTFIAAKPGLFVFPAAALVGELVVSRLGIPQDLPALERLPARVVDGALAAALLPQRPLDGHKGTFGKVMLAVGSANYIGAAALAGESACRSGAGLVTVAATSRVVGIVAGQLREPTWLPLADTEGAIAESASGALAEAAQAYQSLLIGCGLGLHKSTRAFVWRLLNADALPPLIIDADALNALSSRPDWQRTLPPHTILTPHSGEMARLTGLAMEEIQADRWRVARRFAEAWNLVVVLKGAHTIIAAPDGRASVIPFKTDALATAGTGDVLAGLIAGLRAQGAAAYESACLGAYVHALAGVLAAERVKNSRSVIAGDLLDALGDAFDQIEGN